MNPFKHLVTAGHFGTYGILSISNLNVVIFQAMKTLEALSMLCCISGVRLKLTNDKSIPSSTAGSCCSRDPVDHLVPAWWPSRYRGARARRTGILSYSGHLPGPACQRGQHQHVQDGGGTRPLGTAADQVWLWWSVRSNYSQPSFLGPRTMMAGQRTSSPEISLQPEFIGFTFQPSNTLSRGGSRPSTHMWR